MVILLALSALEMTPWSESRWSGFVQEYHESIVRHYEATWDTRTGGRAGRSTGSQSPLFGTSILHIILPTVLQRSILSLILGIPSITYEIPKRDRIRSDEQGGANVEQSGVLHR